MIARIALVMISLLALSAVSGATETGELGANVYVKLSKKIVPSVVNISTLTTVKSPYGQNSPEDMLRKFFGDFFRQYHGGQRGGRPGPGEEEDGFSDEGPVLPPGPGGSPKNLPKAMSLGTGFVIDPSGLILTNNHVVAEADEIKIFFTESTDEKPTDGEVVGRDTELDVALIRVKTKHEMVAVGFGDSDALEVGEYVLAVGNPFGQGHSVTHGIISAKGRLAPDFPLANYIQTDAPINPGNSGGPLVNLKGEVIGINNAIDQRAQGIGFAIPINLVKKILPQLRTKGSVSRGFIGVVVNEMTPEVAAKLNVDKDLHAPFVTHVTPNAPAEKAGLKAYDVILELDGKPVHSSSELVLTVTGIEVNKTVPLKISRNGSEKTLNITIAQRPGVHELAGGGPSTKPKKGKKSESRVETGMTLEDISPDTAQDLQLGPKAKGAVVIATAYGAAADKAGIVRGDLILEVDRKPVKDVDSFYSLVKEKKSYLVRIRRLDAQGAESFSVVVLDLK